MNIKEATKFEKQVSRFDELTNTLQSLDYDHNKSSNAEWDEMLSIFDSLTKEYNEEDIFEASDNYRAMVDFYIMVNSKPNLGKFL